MRILLLALATASLAPGQSHPSWWNYVPPDATALVGIQWEPLRNSILADPINSEFSSGGGLGFPDLPFLKGAREILIAAPNQLVIATGSFPAATTREQAIRMGWKQSSYQGVPLWIAPKDALAVARVSDSLLLIGQRKDLESAIPRTEGPDISRRYSPLLARGARLAQDWDLWITTSRMPDPLASLFVPFEISADAFQGGVSVRETLQLGAAYQMSSNRQATAAAEQLRRGVPSFPAIARGLEIQADGDAVLLTLSVDHEQLASNLRQPKPGPVAQLAKPKPEPRPEPIVPAPIPYEPV